MQESTYQRGIEPERLPSSRSPWLKTRGLGLRWWPHRSRRTVVRPKADVGGFTLEEEPIFSLRGIWIDGERTVAKHMYAYLFDQGLEFHIEPQSISGEADLVVPELVLDAKLFDGDSSRHGKRYVLSGVNQLLTYTRDFLQQVGYLVVYRTCPEDLQFPFARSDMLVPFMVVDGRIIYFLMLDVREYGASASKRGTLKAHVIDEEEVRTVIKGKRRPARAALNRYEREIERLREDRSTMSAVLQHVKAAAGDTASKARTARRPKSS